ncbi:reverse transcriptase domain-containing protein [Tanacetum coccineum]
MTMDVLLHSNKILRKSIQNSKSSITLQRRVNPIIKEVVKKEVIKLLDAGLIYPIFDSLWVSPVQAPITIKPDWSLPFEIICDASDYDVGALLGQRIDKHFKPIHYASKTMNEAQENYTTTEGRLLRVIHDKKGAKNLAADHLSRLENPDLGKLTKAEIRDLFPKERLMKISDKNNELCKECHLPIELEHKALLAEETENHGLTKAKDNRFLQINELNEMSLNAYENSISYKERTKRWHDKRIKAPTNYEKGDNVLLFNLRLRLFLEKLKSRWYGPFSVCKDMKNGAIELYDEDGNGFIVNKQ